jgi:hypothetical protein
MGDFVADAIHADAGTDIALVNSGSIRGSRVNPPGPITRRMLVEIHPFACEQRVLVGPEAGNLVVEALAKYVAARREIAPQIDGRITFR